jgi:hypothetical protein
MKRLDRMETTCSTMATALDRVFALVHRVQHHNDVLRRALSIRGVRVERLERQNTALRVAIQPLLRLKVPQGRPFGSDPLLASPIYGGPGIKLSDQIRAREALDPA